MSLLLILQIKESTKIVDVIFDKQSEGIKMLNLLCYFTNIKMVKFISNNSTLSASKEIFPLSSEICSLEIPNLTGLILKNFEAGMILD